MMEGDGVPIFDILIPAASIVCIFGVFLLCWQVFHLGLIASILLGLLGMPLPVGSLLLLTSLQNALRERKEP